MEIYTKYSSSASPSELSTCLHPALCPAPTGLPGLLMAKAPAGQRAQLHPCLGLDNLSLPFPLQA